MGFFKKLLGICDTPPPADQSCWAVTDGALTIDLDRTPELEVQGGAVRLEGGSLAKTRVLVVRDGDGGFHAFENRCTHGGRRLDHLAESGQVKCCSIGQSIFDYQGDNKSGSAKKPITTLTVELDGRTLRVGLN